MKSITTTVTSTIYQTLGDYLMDPQTPAFPAGARNNQESSESFNWESYAEKFLTWGGQGVARSTDRVGLNLQVYLQDTEQKLTSNFARIVKRFKNYPSKLKEIEQILFTQGGYLNLPIKPGIVFTIPLGDVSREALLVHGVKVVSNNEPAFKAQALHNLEMDQGYVKVFENEDSKKSLKYTYPEISVWVWCRSLSTHYTDLNNELEGAIFNITPFIKNLSITNTKDGGNFNISLFPVAAERDPASGSWVVKSSSMLYSLEGRKEELLNYLDIYDQRNEGGEIVQEQLLLHNLINPNDLVFIRFETLEIEKEKRELEEDFIISQSQLPGNIYDMIGLVDRNKSEKQYELNSADISITGRDLSKLFIEDGSYFYSMENKQGVLYLNGGASAKNNFTQRIISTNAYQYLGLYFNNSIENILKFIIQQLANISVVPNSLFSSYGDQETNTRITREFLNNDQQVSRDTKVDQQKYRDKNLDYEKDLKRELLNFRLQQFSINPNISEISIKKSNDKVFNNLVNYITYTIDNRDEFGQIIARFSQEVNSYGSVAEQESLYTSRYLGWYYHYNSQLQEDVEEDVFPSIFITTETDVDLKLFYQIVDINTITVTYDVENLLNKVYKYILSIRRNQENINNREVISPANGIWQIVKLVIDKKVAQRLLIDSSLSSATGSLINYLKKVASEPFVELFMDTYGDQFYIIVRQPPTDQVGMLSYLNNSFQDIDNLDPRDNSTQRSPIVTLNEYDIASVDLAFDDSEVYSWYHFVPQASFIGNSSRFSTSFIPAIYFEEYAAVWGAKSLDLVHNYTNYYRKYQEDTPQTQFSDLQKQVFLDMKYLVESNQYMPFARKGTIVIKGGDRRIKVGNPIRLNSTGEIFWVEAVNNTYTIGLDGFERSTSIRVSRGLQEAFIKGVKGSVLNETVLQNSDLKVNPEVVYSYFNIINTKLNFSKTKKQKIYETRKTQTPVNKTKGFSNTQGTVKEPIIDEKEDPRLLSQLGYKSARFSSSIEKYLSELTAPAQKAFRQFIYLAEKQGWEVTITSGYRSYTQQATLYQKNKKNAKPGTSPHEFRRALDMNFKATRNINGIQKGYVLLKAGGLQDNEANRRKVKPVWIRSALPILANTCGLMWGGDYASYTDNVHFELPVKGLGGESQSEEVLEEQEYITTYEEVEVGEKEIVDESAVFSDFRVNKDVFNFFLKKMQMGVSADISTGGGQAGESLISTEQMNMLTSNERRSVK